MTELRVHVVAHKTATTHLQDSLKAALPGIAARGVSFAPRAVLREGVDWGLLDRRPSARTKLAVLARPVRRLFAPRGTVRLRQSASSIHEEVVGASLQDRLGACITRAGPLAISEENLPGPPHAALGDKL